jgi:hypothetical protein
MDLPNSNCHRVLQPRYTSPLETLLASPLKGVQRGSTTGLQGMEGTSWGGELVLVSACLAVSPPIMGGQAHTHAKNAPPSALARPRSMLRALCQRKSWIYVIFVEVVPILVFLFWISISLPLFTMTMKPVSSSPTT